MTGQSYEIIDQAKATGRTYLMEHESKAILESLGITTTKSMVARTEDEAVEIFRSLDSPVALKVLSRTWSINPMQAESSSIWRTQMRCEQPFGIS